MHSKGIYFCDTKVAVMTRRIKSKSIRNIVSEGSAMTHAHVCLSKANSKNTHEKNIAHYFQPAG